MNFYNIQILSSVIPYHSTIFVTVVTMIQLARKRASFQMWLLFMLFFLGSAFVANILGGLLENWHSVARVIVEALVYAFGNYGMVMLQKKAAGKK